MKRLLFILALIVIAVVAMGVTKECTASNCIGIRLNDHEQRLEALEADKLLLAAVANLEAYKAGLQDDLGELSSMLNAAQVELSEAQSERWRVIGSTASINTMVASFTPDMGIVGCRTFDGISMEPTFDTNSLVCISQDPGYLATASIGDIVIAYCPQYSLSVIHRIVGESEAGFTLQGDNVSGPDPCIVSTVAWKVTGIALGVFW